MMRRCGSGNCSIAPMPTIWFLRSAMRAHQHVQDRIVADAEPLTCCGTPLCARMVEAGGVHGIGAYPRYALAAPPIGGTDRRPAG